MTMTHMLHILPSERQPDDIMEVNKMELIPGGKYAYPYLVGCKTGYTDVARSTLVSCAEKDGMKLICVVMKDENLIIMKIRLLCSTMDSVISREQTSLRRRRNIISTMRELLQRQRYLRKFQTDSAIEPKRQYYPAQHDYVPGCCVRNLLRQYRAGAGCRDHLYLQ